MSERHLPGTPGYRSLNTAMALAGLAAFGVMYATQPLLPAIADDFDASPAGASLTVSVTTGALALLVLPATVVGRRFGRITAVRAGLVVAVVLTAACSVAPTFASLLVLRGLTGVALAAVVALAMGHVAAEVDPTGLAAAMGYYIAGNTLGGAGGRVLTSVVLDVAPWRVALGVLAVAAAVAVAAFWRLLPDPVGEEAPATARGRTPPLHPVVLATLLVVPFCLMGAFAASYNYLIFRLVGSPFDLSIGVAGLVFLAYFAGTASSAFAGRAAAALGRGPVLLGSTLLMGAGVAITLPDVLSVVAVGVLVLTVGFFGAHSVASGWAPVLDPEPPGRAGSFYVMSYYAGSSLFGAVGGTAWHAGGWTATAAMLGGLVAVGLVAATTVAFCRRRRVREAEVQIASPVAG